MTTAEFIGGPADGTVMAFPEDDITGPPPTYAVAVLSAAGFSTQPAGPPQTVDVDQVVYRRMPSPLDDGPVWWYMPELVIIRTTNPTEGKHR